MTPCTRLQFATLHRFCPRLGAETEFRSALPVRVPRVVICLNGRPIVDASTIIRVDCRSATVAKSRDQGATLDRLVPSAMREAEVPLALHKAVTLIVIALNRGPIPHPFSHTNIRSIVGSISLLRLKGGRAGAAQIAASCFSCGGRLEDVSWSCASYCICRHARRVRRRWQFERRPARAETERAKERQRTLHDYHSATDDVRVVAHAALHFIEHAIRKHRGERRNDENYCAHVHIVGMQHGQQRLAVQPERHRARRQRHVYDLTLREYRWKRNAAFYTIDLRNDFARSNDAARRYAERRGRKHLACPFECVANGRRGVRYHTHGERERRIRRDDYRAGQLRVANNYCRR